MPKLRLGGDARHLRRTLDFAHRSAIPYSITRGRRVRFDTPTGPVFTSFMPRPENTPRNIERRLRRRCGL